MLSNKRVRRVEQEAGRGQSLRRSRACDRDGDSADVYGAEYVGAGIRSMGEGTGGVRSGEGELASKSSDTLLGCARAGSRRTSRRHERQAAVEQRRVWMRADETVGAGARRSGEAV